MKLSETHRDLRWQIEVVAYRCLHAVEYFQGVIGHGTDFWKFSNNCLGETACLLWCHLFNSRKKDPVHYWKLFGNNQLVTLSQDFQYHNVQHRLWSAAKLDEKAYENFRTQVVDFRNKYISHREYEIDTIIFPDVEKIAAMCLELRVLLEETVRTELGLNSGDSDLEQLGDYYKAHQNAAIVAKCRKEVASAVRNVA